MEQKNRSMGLVILFLGLAIIFAGFFILFPAGKRNDVFWLDLSAACLVYLVNVEVRSGLFTSIPNFDRQVAGLGIRLLSSWTYTVIALAIIFYGLSYEIRFRYQLLFQLADGFFLVVSLFAASVVVEKASQVSSEQKGLRKGKEEILKQLNQLEILFGKDAGKWADEKRQVDILKEDARYLSPANDPYAAEMESEIVDTMRRAYDFATRANGSNSEVLTMLTQSTELLKQRKKVYSN